MSMVESWYDIEYLPKSELYEQLTAGTTRALTEAGSIVMLKPGGKLFSAGDTPDRMHIIRSGIIEVWRKGVDGKWQVVAYLGPGDAIGETVMLTGSRHESEARAPEGAELLQIRREAFVDLCRRTPELMMRLMVVFAHRLEAAYKRETIERRRQLKGSLQHFDLPTVLQTVGRSQGMLSIHKGLGVVLAEIEVQAGMVQYARHGHLRGIEAFYQLFQSPAEGEFVFREGFKLPPEDRGPLVGRPIDQALIATMSHFDEMRGLIDRFPDTDRIYLPRYDELRWVEADSTVAANDLWACLHRGQTFSKALETLPYCHARLFKILAKLVNTEQVAPAD